jgi:hypothetical protein
MADSRAEVGKLKMGFGYHVVPESAKNKDRKTGGKGGRRRKIERKGEREERRMSNDIGTHLKKFPMLKDVTI